MGVELIEVPVRNLGEMEVELEKLSQQSKRGLDGIILMPNTLNHSKDGWDAIRRFAGKLRLPIGGSSAYTVEQGVLYSTGNDMNTPANRKAAEEVGVTLDGVQQFMQARGIFRMIDTINSSGRRVADIVSNMLGFARIITARCWYSPSLVQGQYLSSVCRSME